MSYTSNSLDWHLVKSVMMKFNKTTILQFCRYMTLLNLFLINLQLVLNLISGVNLQTCPRGPSCCTEDMERKLKMVSKDQYMKAIKMAGSNLSKMFNSKAKKFDGKRNSFLVEIQNKKLCYEFSSIVQLSYLLGPFRRSIFHILFASKNFMGQKWIGEKSATSHSFLVVVWLNFYFSKW